MALKELGDIRTVAVLPHLGRALSDSNREVRREAAESLGSTRLQEAIPFLQRALNDADAGVAREAAKAIREIEEKTKDRAQLKAERQKQKLLKQPKRN